jgi:L-lactate dehydrogenase complex protein LldG
MSEPSRSMILDAVRNALQRKPEDSLAERPPVVSPRQAASQIEELQLLIHEVEKLSGHAQLLSPHQIQAALSELVQTYQVKQAVLWDTPTLRQLEIAAKLENLGVKVVPAGADQQTVAECDLGVTEADFALPETGTLGLLSNAEQPRLVSLLPRLHLAIMGPSALRADLGQVFAEAKAHSYLILITGPSRTSDIELTPTLGVHGPRDVCVWILDEIRQTGDLPPPD